MTATCAHNWRMTDDGASCSECLMPAYSLHGYAIDAELARLSQEIARLLLEMHVRNQDMLIVLQRADAAYRDGFREGRDRQREAIANGLFADPSTSEAIAGHLDAGRWMVAP